MLYVKHAWRLGVLLSAVLLILSACVPASGITPGAEPVASPTTTENSGPPEAPSTPLIVHLSMPKAPKVGEEVEVALEIQAYQDAPDTTAQIELPEGVRLVRGEPRWEGHVPVESPVRMAVTVIFTEEGEYALRGSAFRTVNEGMTWGDDDFIYLTVREGSGSFGYESGGESQLSASPVPTEKP